MSDLAAVSEETERDPEIPFTLAFRAVKTEDFNFVLSSWMKSYRDTKRTIKNPAYFAGHQRLIAALGERRSMIIGCDADAPEWIVGFACGQMLDDGRILVDYVYVKQPYRERGIAKALVAALGWSPGMGVVASHWNRICNSLSQRFLIEHDEYYIMLGADL